ncbi:hypothetical protein NDA01_19940 [Trichocoleus desertorum AS-A10]|uniref:hypothetical protein n=1 Tax=Trichocoleus desertorum TaxID=1481672 RepID=UPI00329A7593
MTHARRFEELIAEHTQTLDTMRTTIERSRYLINVMVAQINLEYRSQTLALTRSTTWRGQRIGATVKLKPLPLFQGAR